MGRAQIERSVVLSEPRQLWDARIWEVGLDAAPTLCQNTLR